LRGPQFIHRADTPGVIFLNGQHWQEQRRFALRTLRDFGLGKDGMEDLIAEEVERLISIIDATHGKPQMMNGFFGMSTLRALWKVLTSEDLLESKHDLQSIYKRLLEVFTFANTPIGFMMLTMPKLTKMLRMFGIDTMGDVDKDFIGISSKIIQEHEETYDEGSPRDFTDVYLKMRYESKDMNGTSFHGLNGLINQKGMMVDLIQAGTDTTSRTLEWAILYMLQNPSVAKKVQSELDNVTGGSRLPCWSDRTELPYTEAVLTEIQRLASVFSNGVPRAANKNVTVMGFTIPAESDIWPNLDYIMKNPLNFPNPGQFDPERHFKDGKHVPHPHVIPFGYGKRRCLGETLAKMEVYRFFTGLMHHFDIKAKPGDVLDSSSEPGSVRMPKEYYAIFEPRQ